MRSNTLNRVDFDYIGFENLAYQNAGLFSLERAVYCPCRRDDNGNPQDNCLNCNGSGWLFVESVEVRGFIQSLTYNQEQRLAIPEIRFTSNFTLSETFEYRLNYFDKLSLLDGNGIATNTIQKFEQIENEFKEIVWQTTLPYKIKSIEYIILYISNSEIRKLTSDEYSFETNIIRLNDMLFNEFTEDIKASIRFNHLPVFHVLQTNHIIRNSKELYNGEEITNNFSLQYLIREQSFYLKNGYPI